MAAGQPGELPNDLLQARKCFQDWRSRQRGRGRIPRELWELAVALVSRHGLSRTASVLRLDYYSLKKHAETAAPDLPARQPAFVQLPAPLPPGKQALFELDQGAGAVLRVQLLGYDTADLETLARHFGNTN
jgi:hypothetical protein